MSGIRTWQILKHAVSARAVCVLIAVGFNVVVAPWIDFDLSPLLWTPDSSILDLDQAGSSQAGLTLRARLPPGSVTFRPPLSEDACSGSKSILHPRTWELLWLSVEPFVRWDGEYFLGAAAASSGSVYSVDFHHAFFPGYPILVRSVYRVIVAATGPLVNLSSNGRALATCLDSEPPLLVAACAILLSNVAFVLAAVGLYHVARLILRLVLIYRAIPLGPANTAPAESPCHHPSHVCFTEACSRADDCAVIAALLFSWSPANIFVSSIYSESCFACLTNWGLIGLLGTELLLIERDLIPVLQGSTRPASFWNGGLVLVLSVGLFGFATLTRSNGVLAVIPVLYAAGRNVLQPWVGTAVVGGFGMTRRNAFCGADEDLAHRASVNSASTAIRDESAAVDGDAEPAESTRATYNSNGPVATYGRPRRRHKENPMAERGFQGTLPATRTRDDTDSATPLCPRASLGRVLLVVVVASSTSCVIVLPLLAVSGYAYRRFCGYESATTIPVRALAHNVAADLIPSSFTMIRVVVANFFGAANPQQSNYEVGSDSPVWCYWRFPSIYGYIQQAYWNVGFLRYWRLPKVDRFFVAAAPVVLSTAVLVSTRPRWRYSAGLIHYILDPVWPFWILLAITLVVMSLIANVEVIIRMLVGVPWFYVGASCLLFCFGSSSPLKPDKETKRLGHFQWPQTETNFGKIPESRNSPRTLELQEVHPKTLTSWTRRRLVRLYLFFHWLTFFLGPVFFAVGATWT